MLDITGKTWTYGAEHELGDWDTREGWEGYGMDPEPNIMNSNGIAGDPKLKDYPFGGEINTPATETPEEQGYLFDNFIRNRRIYVSQRVGTHIHIRIPNLLNNVQALKKIQRFACDNHEIWKVIDPLPYPDTAGLSEEDATMTRKWIQYLRRSHWTRIPEDRVQLQLRAKTFRGFLDAEAKVNRATGERVFFLQPRATVNLRQLDQTDTIEFRPFMQATNSIQVVNAAKFCREFLLAALNDGNIEQVYWQHFSKAEFPPLPVFVPWMERRWTATSYSVNNRKICERNRRAILEGKFDDVSNKGFSYLKY